MEEEEEDGGELRVKTDCLACGNRVWVVEPCCLAGCGMLSRGWQAAGS